MSTAVEHRSDGVGDLLGLVALDLLDVRSDLLRDEGLHRGRVALRHLAERQVEPVEALAELCVRLRGGLCTRCVFARCLLVVVAAGSQAAHGDQRRQPDGRGLASPHVSHLFARLLGIAVGLGAVLENPKELEPAGERRGIVRIARYPAPRPAVRVELEVDEEPHRATLHAGTPASHRGKPLDQRKM